MLGENMNKVFSGSLVGEGKKIALVVSRWNELMSSKLLEGAKDILVRHGVSMGDIELAMVPGSFELAFAAQKLVSTKRYDAVVCLGVLIRGATPHFEYVASEAAKGIAQVGLQSGIPVTFGVITSDTLEQALERAGSKAGNKGVEAALAALEMTNLITQIDAG